MTLLVLSLMGIVIQVFSTRWGIGITPDSVAYIAAARELLSGHGYPITHWPPLLSVSLATIGLFRVDPLVGAKWLNAVLFATNIALAGTIVARYTRGSLWASFLAAFLMLTSSDMLMIHSMAWSEPLFIFFGFLGLLFLADYLDRQLPGLLLASAGAVALAFLTRYPGAAFVATGSAGLVLLSRRGIWKRLADAAVFVVISSAPMALWMLRNVHTAGNATGRSVAFHPITRADIMTGLLTFSTWLLPKRIPGGVILSLVLAAGFCVASVAAWQRIRARGEDTPVRQDLAGLPALLLLFVAAYLGLLVIAISFLDVAVLDTRIMSLVFVAGLLFVACTVYRLAQSVQASPSLRFGLIVLCVGAAGFYLGRGVLDASASHRHGLGYASTSWLQSETIREVKTIPARVQIYSNGPDVIYILTGRPALWIPAKSDLSGSANEAYPAQLLEMKRALQRGKAVLVFFDQIWYLPGKDELERELPLTIVRKTGDGAIYKMKGWPIADLEVPPMPSSPPKALAIGATGQRAAAMRRVTARFPRSPDPPRDREDRFSARRPPRTEGPARSACPARPASSG